MLPSHVSSPLLRIRFHLHMVHYKLYIVLYCIVWNNKEISQLIDWVIDGCIAWFGVSDVLCIAADSNITLLQLFLRVTGAACVRHQLSRCILSSVDRCQCWTQLLPLFTSSALSLMYPSSCLGINTVQMWCWIMDVIVTLKLLWRMIVMYK